MAKTPKTPKTPTAQVAGRLVVLAVLGVLGVLGAAAMSMHQQLFLLCVRNAPPTPPLPYDAEVEYLQSTGTQHINTGIYARDGLLVSIRAMVTVNPSSTQKYWFRGPGSGSRSSFGMCDDYTYRTLRFALNTASFGSSTFVISNNTWYDVVLCSAANNKYATVGGATVYEPVNSRAGVATSPVYLYASNNGTLPHDGLRVASFSVRDAGTDEVLIDLIAVRKDGVGYMYDRVSGNLLGNSGTGDFGIGPDK